MKMVILHWLLRHRTSYPRAELDEILAQQQVIESSDHPVFSKINFKWFPLWLLLIMMMALLVGISLHVVQGAAISSAKQSSTPMGNPGGWQIQTIATRGDTGRYTDLVLDANGFPRISYIERVPFLSGADEQLHYAYWDGLRWHTELVAEDLFFSTEFSGFTSIALGPNGDPHIAYVDDNHLHYAHWDGSEWDTEIVDTLTWIVTDASLQVDSDNTPHISYIQGGELFYTHQIGLTWQTEVVDAGITKQPSLALSTNDLPRISYIDSQTDVLKYAAYDGLLWDIQTVDSGESMTGPTSLALTTTGIPHISYIALSGNLKYAYRYETSWQTEIAITLPNSNAYAGLALDMDNQPHIVYSGTDKPLTHLNLVDGNWQSQILDPGDSLVAYDALDVDEEGDIHVSYFDYDYGDLRYVTWDPNWIIRTVQAPSFVQATSLQISQDNPHMSYYDGETTKIKLIGWDEGWSNIELPLNPISSQVQQTSLAFTSDRIHMSYSVNGLLIYLVWGGDAWQVELLDSPNVGDYNQLLALDNQNVRIAYWDKVNFRVKLAELQLDDTWQIHTHAEGPPLDYNSGYLSATVLPEGKIGISYYNGLQGNLHLAIWDPNTDLWTDELVDGAYAYTGLLNALQTDGTTGAPVVAYYSAGADTIYYGYKDGETWQTEPAVLGAGGVTSLFLKLGLNSRTRPQIGYTTYEGALRVASKETGAWDVDTISTSPTLDNVSMALSNRAHLVFTDLGLYYAFRSATLTVDPEVPGPPGIGTQAYNPMDACVAVLKRYFFPNSDLVLRSPDLFLGSFQSLNDMTIFEEMTMLFAASPGGDYYIDLYAQHGSEMGQIALDDPQLLWDAYGTLQNFLPGLETLVQGNGDEMIITQQMVDDALDIWQRTANAASPELVAVINAELARYNNLQDFVGLTFAEWLAALGAAEADNQVYLPVIRK